MYNVCHRTCILNEHQCMVQHLDIQDIHPINNIICFAGIFKQTVTGFDKLGRPYKQEIKTEAHKYCGGNGPEPAVMRCRGLSIMMWIIMHVREVHDV